MAGVVLSVLGAYYPTHGERDSQLDHGGSAQHCAAAVCVRVVEMSDARSQPVRRLRRHCLLRQRQKPLPLMSPTLFVEFGFKAFRHPGWYIFVAGVAL